MGLIKKPDELYFHMKQWERWTVADRKYVFGESGRLIYSSARHKEICF